MAEVGGIAADKLRQIVERVERLEEERRGLANDIKDVLAEAKALGFDVAVLRQLLKIRKMDKQQHDELESLLEVYMHALGMA